jgi:DNA-binding SARP family transcriptional activator
VQSIDFRLLGPFEVRIGGQHLPVTSPKHRVLLAGLLLRAGQPVAVGELTEALWQGPSLPANPRRAVQLYAARLRDLLAARDADPLISTWADGYQANVEQDQTDLGRFRRLLSDARKAGRDGALDDEAALLEAALAQWRGEPLADVPSELLHREAAPPLAEQRMRALERLFDVKLRLGRHVEVTGELLALTARNPLRERLWALLVIALDRSGRRADALSSYHAVRSALVAELGTEPGRELQAAHAAVLAGHPRSRPVPRQLPAGVLPFTGRAAELSWLDEQLPCPEGRWQPMRLVLVTGTAGIGKTVLAVHWARRNADCFPDGQLWADLRGTGDGAALAPSQVLRRFLRALGVKDAEIPADLDEAAALYRSRADGRRMLVVLDNAASSEQVRPLLPAAPYNMTLVASRRHLSGLVAAEGGCLLRLELPAHGDARRMLSARLGGRAIAEPDAVDRIIALCARLPRALGLAAARASAFPGLSLNALADELEAAHGSREEEQARSSWRRVQVWSGIGCLPGVGARPG